MSSTRASLANHAPRMSGGAREQGNNGKPVFVGDEEDKAAKTAAPPTRRRVRLSDAPLEPPEITEIPPSAAATTVIPASAQRRSRGERRAANPYSDYNSRTYGDRRSAEEERIPLNSGVADDSAVSSSDVRAISNLIDDLSRLESGDDAGESSRRRRRSVSIHANLGRGNGGSDVALPGSAPAAGDGASTSSLPGVFEENKRHSLLSAGSASGGGGLKGGESVAIDTPGITEQVGSSPARVNMTIGGRRMDTLVLSLARSALVRNCQAEEMDVSQRQTAIFRPRPPSRACPGGPVVSGPPPGEV